MLEALKRRGGGRIVFSSSGGTVYGRLRSIPVPDMDPLDPISAYGVSKVTAEKYCQYYHTAYGIDARVARISNRFGAGQNPARPQGAVTTFVHRALGGKPIEIWGDGEVVRDFIHITDVADALIALANARLGSGPEMPIYNIGSGSGSSLNHIIHAIEQQVGSALNILRQPGRAFDVPISILDIARIRDGDRVGSVPDLAGGRRPI